MSLGACDILAMGSTVRGRAVTKFGVMHRPAGKLLYLGMREIWQKGRFAPFFERLESASTTFSELVRYSSDEIIEELAQGERLPNKTR